MVKSNPARIFASADLYSILLLIIFVLLAYILDNFIQPVFIESTLFYIGTIFSLIPGIVWLFFFYRRDRYEPEPKGLVLQVFVLGGLVASAIGIPFLNNYLSIDNWVYRNHWNYLVGSILVIGFTQEFLKFLAVRFSVFHSEEFNEPADGIIYTTAVGLGYATAINIFFVVSSGGVNLGPGAINITITALAHAGFSGILGYFIGIDKFSSKPFWWVGAGITIASILNGTFFFLRNEVSRATIYTKGGYVQNWYGLGLAVLFTFVMTAIISRLTITQADQGKAHRYE